MLGFRLRVGLLGGREGRAESKAGGGSGLFELGVNFFEGFADALEVGVDLHGLAIAVGGVVEFAELEEAVAFAGPGTEVAGHEFDGLVTVFDGGFVAFLQVAGNGALVKGFGEGGVGREGVGEVFFGFFEAAGVEEAGAFADFVVGDGLAGAEENGPEGMFGHAVDDVVGVFELAEEGADAVSVADPGKGEEGDFACVVVGAVEKGDDLGGLPASADSADEAVQILLFEERFEGGDKLLAINQGERTHRG